MPLQPVGVLMIEHRLIERMVRLMRDEIDRIGAHGRVDPDFLDDAVDFMRTYADICHHGKEEHILFRDLESKPLADGLRSTMNELIEEHAFARKTVRAIEAAKERYLLGEKNAPADLVGVLNTIALFYPRHIDKEDRHFFIPCMDYFSSEEKGRMLQEFEDFDRRLIHERYRSLVSLYEGMFSSGRSTERPAGTTR